MKKRINKEEIVCIIKYIFSAGSSFAVDLACFTVLCLIFKTDTIGIFISTAIARTISSIYNYLINSRIVFKNKNKKSLIMYFFLVVIQMTVSATKVYVTLIKFAVDIIIFCINYIIQKEIIFKWDF